MKNPGKLVKTKDGKKGRTFNKNGLIKGKVPVYLQIKDFVFSENAILCSPESLTIIGYID